MIWLMIQRVASGDSSRKEEILAGWTCALVISVIILDMMANSL